MFVILKCKSPDGEQQLVLRPGQRGRVGSSDWVEFSLPSSPLQQEHFVVDTRDSLKLICSEECYVTVNDQVLSELDLSHGLQFAVGLYEFSVLTSGEPDLIPQRNEEIQTSNSTHREPWWTSVEWEMVDCPQQTIQLLQQLDSLEEATQRLLELDLSTAALRLLATQLPPPACVEWSLEAIEQRIVTTEELASNSTMAHVRGWLVQPDEPARQLISLDGEIISPADWIAQAVVWTGGSMAPEGVPPIPPPRTLYGIACATAVQLHLASGRAASSLAQIIENGLKIVERSHVVFQQATV